MRSARQMRPLALCAGVAALLAACGAPIDAPASGSGSLSASELAQPYRPVTTPTVAKGVCLERHGSSAKPAAAFVRDLARALRTWPAKLPTDQSTTFAGSPGLDLTIRVVAADSAPTTDAPPVHISTPPVSGLRAEPNLTAKGVLEYGGPYFVWQAGLSEIKREVTQAHVSVLREANAVLSLPVDPSSGGVMGCLAALAASVPSVEVEPMWSVLVVSALDVTEPINLSPQALSMARVQVVQSCPSGNVARCSLQARTFTALVKAAGAPSVQISPAERVDVVVASWLASGT
jgi:hypothetical protein